MSSSRSGWPACCSRLRMDSTSRSRRTRAGYAAAAAGPAERADARVCRGAVRVLERTTAAGAERGEHPHAEVERAGRRGEAYALRFYEDEVDPLLTPVTIDPSHPFPRVLNKALCIALLLRHKRSGRAASAGEHGAGGGDGAARAAAAGGAAAPRDGTTSSCCTS